MGADGVIGGAAAKGVRAWRRVQGGGSVRAPGVVRRWLDAHQHRCSWRDAVADLDQQPAHHAGVSVVGTSIAFVGFPA